jgi:hypothetical protein
MKKPSMHSTRAALKTAAFPERVVISRSLHQMFIRTNPNNTY